MVHLASYAIQSLEDSYAFFDKGDEKYFDKVEKYETAVNSIDEELTTYLIEISNEFLSVYENEILVSVLDSVRDLERIGDLAVASANLSQHIHNKGIEFSGTAKAELEMFIIARTVLILIVFVLLWMMTKCLQVKLSFVMKS